ncbi:MAG: phosphotransferase, partial [Propionibacteriaceae bacterium]|nr:phosphotransferase [Propionibacteriaceae bacterium]
MAQALRDESVIVTRHETWGHPQQHKSIIIWDEKGRQYWLKIQQQDSPFAGIGIEAHALNTLQGTELGPQLLTQGCLNDGTPYLVTSHVAGTPLSDTPLTEALTEMTECLAAMDHLPVEVWPQHDGTHLFSTRPDLTGILTETLNRNDPNLANRITTATAAATPPMAVPIHGSLGLSNVIVGRHLTLLDWEACRIGPREFDLATLAGELIDAGRTHEADLWLKTATLL